MGSSLSLHAWCAVWLWGMGRVSGWGGGDSKQKGTRRICRVTKHHAHQHTPLHIHDMTSHGMAIHKSTHSHSLSLQRHFTSHTHGAGWVGGERTQRRAASRWVPVSSSQRPPASRQAGKQERQPERISQPARLPLYKKKCTSPALPTGSRARQQMTAPEREMPDIHPSIHSGQRRPQAPHRTTENISAIHSWILPVLAC